VTTPDGNGGVYRINLRQKSEINQRHPYTTVWVDRWSGHIKEVRDPNSFSWGGKMITWMWPLHTGEALGTYGRLSWFLVGQGLFLLYITGMLRWLHKKEKIRDRPIGFALPDNLKSHLKTSILQLLLRLDRQMNLWAQKALPLLTQTIAILAKMFERGMDYYQSRSKK
jgi:uncharacterized iron-regulated membrane protein